MRFTGHERDLWNTASTNDDLDYMHARHYNPQLGRFLQIDPLAGSVSLPQTWNRYAYVAGNPTSLIDPTGRWLAPPFPGFSGWSLDWFLRNATDYNEVTGQSPKVNVDNTIDVQFWLWDPRQTSNNSGNPPSRDNVSVWQEKSPGFPGKAYRDNHPVKEIPPKKSPPTRAPDPPVLGPPARPPILAWRKSCPALHIKMFVDQSIALSSSIGLGAICGPAIAYGKGAGARGCWWAAAGWLWTLRGAIESTLDVAETCVEWP